MRTEQWLALIVGAYLLLALGYGAVNPLFEAPDEHHHFFTALSIRESGRLPRVESPPDPLSRQEGAQPPLYYLIGAAVIAPVDVGDAAGQLWFNSQVNLGRPDIPHNRNAFVHGAWEAWPWRGYTLAAHLLRALSAALGAGTLLAIYGSGRVLWPDRPARALLAAALVALLPQFSFLHGSISNDPLIILLSALALWQLLRLWPPFDWRPGSPIQTRRGTMNGRLLWLGVTVGLAMMTKTAGLLLLPFTTVWLAAMGWREGRGWRSFVGAVALVAGPALLIGGWVYGRNWLLYGDLTAANQFIALAGGDRGYRLADIWSEADRVWLSLFAFFGWMNVQPPDWVYAVWNGLVVLGAVFGLVGERRSGGAREKSPPPLRSLAPHLLLAAWPALVFLGWLRFSLATSADQGRLLFPALAPMALGLAYGLDRAAARWRPFGGIVVGLAGLTAVYCLVIVIPDAYARPPLLAPDEVPAAARRDLTALGDGLALRGATVETTAVHPGDWLWLRLYWQRNGDVPRDLAESVRLVGPDGATVGRLESYHGRGLYPAALWPAGPVVAERVPVLVGPSIDSGRGELELPARVMVEVGVGGDATAVGEAKIVPRDWPEMTTPVASFGGVELARAWLESETAVAGGSVIVRLRWQVVEPPGRDLTTFVHLGDPARPPLAQADGPPRGGDYPARLWAAGERFDDWYELAIPAGLADGRYPVTVGLYDPATGERLGDGYVVGRLTVEQ